MPLLDPSLYYTSDVKLHPIKVPVKSSKMHVKGAILRKDIAGYIDLLGKIITILTKTGEVKCYVVCVNLRSLGSQAHTWEIELDKVYEDNDR